MSEHVRASNGRPRREAGVSWTRFVAGKLSPVEYVRVELCKDRTRRFSDRKLEVEGVGVCNEE